MHEHAQTPHLCYEHSHIGLPYSGVLKPDINKSNVATELKVATELNTMRHINLLYKKRLSTNSGDS